jgi:Tfp pilus assembly protein PilF
LRRAVEADTYSPDAHHVLGSVLAGNGDPDEGIRHLRRAMELQPDRKDIERSLRVALEMRPARKAD